MEAKNLTKKFPLQKQMQENPGAFSFIQALRLLRFVDKEKPLLSDFVKNSLRIKPYLSLGFPGCDIKEISSKIKDDKLIFNIEATFLGLYGSGSPLPTYYTEELIDDKNESDFVKKDFIDIFNIVFFELFYQSITKYRLLYKICDDKSDVYQNRLYSLMGLGSQKLRDSFDKKDDFLKYLGILTHSPASASGLKNIISDYFKIDLVEINQCIENHVSIPDDQRAFLGLKNTTLGLDCHLGIKIKDFSGSFSISIDEISIEEFHNFIPSGEKFFDLKKIVDFYLDQPLDAKIEISPKKDELKTTTLGGSRFSELGYNTWLFSKDHLPENNKVLFELNN